MSESASAPLSARERAAIAAIVEAFGPDLERFLDARRLASADAEDVRQEVYLRLARYRDFAAVDNVRSFIFRVAENVMRDQARRAGARGAGRHSSIDRVTLADPAPGPERQLEGKEALMAFRAALLDLDPRWRRAFLLSRNDGLTYHAIAKRMGVSVKTVENYIAQALAHFRKRLGEAKR